MNSICENCECEAVNTVQFTGLTLPVRNGNPSEYRDSAPSFAAS